MRTEKQWGEYWKDSSTGKKFVEFIRSQGYSRFIVRYINRFLTKKSRVLEAGCGSASFAGFIKGTYYGMDWCDAALKFAKKNARHQHILKGDITNTKFNDSFFDAVIAQGILEYQKDWTPFINEFSRVSAKKIFLIFPTRLSLAGLISIIVHNKVYRRVYLTDDKIRKKLKNHVKVLKIKRVMTCTGVSKVVLAKPR